MGNLIKTGKEPRIRVGLIHSLTGTMSLSEKQLLNSEKMAIDEINKEGGILGYFVEPVIFDGASLPEQFSVGVKKLVEDGVNTLFGCWTSASRKAVRTIIEAADGLLFYPVQYEGLEESRSICYTGSCLNQQIIPALDWAISNFGNRVFLVGSDYVFPRTANQLIRSMVEEIKGSISGEFYVALGDQDFSEIVEMIRNEKPSIVFSTINGDSNIGFYKQYHANGLVPDAIPIIATSVSETDFSSIADIAAGHYSCWSYFQSLDTLENQKFVSRFKRLYGSSCVVSDPMVTAYLQIYLWKMAVERAGTFVPSVVRQHLIDTSLDSPMGKIKVEKNLHLSKPVRIGKLRADGQFEIVWGESNPVSPLPWLGVENLKFSGKFMVKQGLAALSENINYSVLLEKEIKERKRAEEIAGEQQDEKRRIAQMIRFQNAVIELSRLEIKVPLEQKFNRIIEMSAEAINVERVGIWFLDENKEIISTDGIFILSSREYIPGISFSRSDFPEYFEAIIREPLIDAHNAIYDPRTLEFAEGYLKPQGIVSMLDVPIRLGGEVIGIICFEHVGIKRIWSYNEQAFASSIASIVSIAIEHAERQKVLEEVSKSEERYRFIADIVPAIFWTADTDGVLDYFNNKAFDYSGATFEELQNWGWLPFIHPDDRERVVESWKESLNTGKQWIVENRLLRKDGQYRWHITKANAQLDKDGKIIKWFGTSTDIHELKETNENLRYKNMQLIGTNMDLDNFIYTASHDLKVPIANIEGLLNMLYLKSSEDAEYFEILRMMTNSIDKFKNTVEDLTEVSKVQKMREEDVEEYDVAEIAEEVILNFKIQIKETGGHIEFDFSECPVIKYSRKNLFRILNTLIANALQFRSPERKPEIIIKTKENQDYYILSVSDNGSGIGDSFKKNIFGLFKRANQDSIGRGISLYIIKRIIESTDGKIEFHSEQGKGSTFIVYFRK